jgi:hypothetical protein
LSPYTKELWLVTATAVVAVPWSAIIAQHLSCAIIARPWLSGIIGSKPTFATIEHNPSSEIIALLRPSGIADCQEGLRAV